LEFCEGYTIKLTLTAITILMTLVLFSCRQKEEAPREQQAQPQTEAQPQQQADAGAGVHTAVVQEVLQATAYTYLNVKEKEKDAAYWIAVTKREIQPGTTISFAEGLEMDKFQSKDLQRTFDKVYFVGEVVGDAASPSAGQTPASMAHQMKPAIEKKAISIEPAEGGISIGELFAKRDSYAGKTVLIKGQVTKVNRAIMGRNWVHLQDGTGDADNYDLTVTTNDDANVGDIATFEGTIALKKDFGAGYFYEVIMEDAKKKTQ
jgi:hypothetical protein